MQSDTKTKTTISSEKHSTVLPGATYRLQLHKDFTFAKAIEIVPYLAKLGITHVYASPILKARPGSAHGYDIIEHQELNPEIGNRAELSKLVHVLRQHGMGLIVDFVPNHMGVGSDNRYWMDVLENGRFSEYANYFDIDWQPIKRELAGKVMLPILGDSYGKVMERGELKLVFDPDDGQISLHYYDHHLPINPASYWQVLALRLDELIESLGADDTDYNEYISIINGFRGLHDSRAEFGTRTGEKAVQCRRLAQLCARNGTVRHFVSKNVVAFNDTADANSIQRMHELLEEQNYRLVFWRVAFDEINYRRFFDVNDLAAIRAEDPQVFNDIHSLLFDLVAEKLVDGVRIDHPDGLFNPAGYFAKLQEGVARRMGIDYQPSHDVTVEYQKKLPVYVVAEKILAPFEQLEPAWQVHGTTGYDYMDTLTNLLVNEENEAAFTAIYEDLVGGVQNFEELKRDCKTLILDTIFASELTVLANRLSGIAESSWFFRDFTLGSLRRALRQIVIQFPVYRTYIAFGRTDETAAQYIDWAIALAKRHSSVPSAVYEFVAGVLKGNLPPESFGVSHRSEIADLQARFLEFAMKFQQFTGPVTAKSVEDTLFYRYSRFVALNEVGSEPKRFGTSAAAYHQNAQRQLARPYGLLATSTHDTKRSEDVRARLTVLSEIPQLWQQTVETLMRLSAPFKTILGDEQAPDVNDEYFLYQNILGAFPLDANSDDEWNKFSSRIVEYAIKAMREAKRKTSWVNQNDDYENALRNFISETLNPGSEVFQALREFAVPLAYYGYLNGLVQTALKLTSPGVPDVYQGNELWDFSLVDPDNRRPVDFEQRAKALASVPDSLPIDARFLADTMEQPHAGMNKLAVTAGLLKLRQQYPELLREGAYIPLGIAGSAASHVLAFARTAEDAAAVVAVPLKPLSLLGRNASFDLFKNTDVFQALRSPTTWGDTNLELPESLRSTRFSSLFGGAVHQADNAGNLKLAELYSDFPLAVLFSAKK